MARSGIDEFKKILKNLNKCTQSQINENLKSFLENCDRQSFPMTDDSAALFLYFGNGKSNVAVPGDFNNWSTLNDRMQNIKGTNVYYLLKELPRAARIDYKLAVNGEWITDPLNKRIIEGGFGLNSELRMPGYPEHPELEASGFARGTTEKFIIYSMHFGHSRTVQVHLPPAYYSSEKAKNDYYPCIYFQDGSDYLMLGAAARTTDYMIHKKLIKPVILIFVDPIYRALEYAMNPRYRLFLVEELVPEIGKKYRVLDTRESRALAGASFGGLISAHIAWRHPDVFSKCACQSGFFSFQDYRLLREMANSQVHDIEFYLDCGIFEKAIGGRQIPYGIDILTANRRFQSFLKSRGYLMSYNEFPEGHSWGNWKAHLDDFMYQFWGNDSGRMRNYFSKS